VKTALLLLGISTVIFAANAGELKVGDRAPSGNLIIHIFGDWSDKSDPSILVELTTDYGFMVFNDGNEKQPIPRFELATRASATVQNFSTLEAFEVALAKLPKGSVLQIYRKCGAPTWWGYHEWYDRLMLKTKQLGLTFSEEGRTTCVCPRGH